MRMHPHLMLVADPRHFATQDLRPDRTHFRPQNANRLQQIRQTINQIHV
jgi:hypothetical protein